MDPADAEIAAYISESGEKENHPHFHLARKINMILSERIHRDAFLEQVNFVWVWTIVERYHWFPVHLFNLFTSIPFRSSLLRNKRWQISRAWRLFMCVYQKESHFCRLPAEIIFEIFGYLEPELGHLRLVCQHFYVLATQMELRIIENILITFRDVFNNMGNPANLTMVQRLVRISCDQWIRDASRHSGRYYLRPPYGQRGEVYYINDVERSFDFSSLRSYAIGCKVTKSLLGFRALNFLHLLNSYANEKIGPENIVNSDFEFCENITNCASWMASIRLVYKRKKEEYEELRREAHREEVQEARNRLYAQDYEFYNHWLEEDDEEINLEEEMNLAVENLPVAEDPEDEEWVEHHKWEYELEEEEEKEEEELEEAEGEVDDFGLVGLANFLEIKLEMQQNHEFYSPISLFPFDMAMEHIRQAVDVRDARQLTAIDDDLARMPQGWWNRFKKSEVFESYFEAMKEISFLKF